MALAFCATAHAGVVLSGTRVVYPAAEKEVTLRVQNESQTPRLVQSWLDDGDGTQLAGDSNTPFLLTPPMTRIEPGKGQALRIMYTGEALPQDRESVFWLNVLDVPPRPQGQDGVNYMQVAVRTRIKVFYRPVGLQGDPLGAIDTLQWRLVRDGSGYALDCFNPSDYHVSFNSVGLKGHMPREGVGIGGMVAPHSSQRFALPPVAVPSTARIAFVAINDYGGKVEREADFTR